MKTVLFVFFSSLLGLCLGAGGSVGGSSGGSGDVGRSPVYSGPHFVAAGERFVLSCTLGTNNYIQWIFNGRPIVPGEAGYTIIEGPGPIGHRLSLLNVARAHVIHTGEYKCSPFIAKSHSVYVLSGSLAETEDTKIYREDSSLMLTCDYNLTSAETTWKKNGTEITAEDDHYKMFSNTSMYIASLKRTDIGEFSCSFSGLDEPKFFYIVELQLNKHLPKSTTVLENDKLKLTCQVEGTPIPNVQWLKDGEPLQNAENSTRLKFEENAHAVPNASLLIQPIWKSDHGDYICVISQYSLHLNTTTEVRVKDIYAALWPFLGIVAEVTLLCAIIFIYEKRRIKPNLEAADMDDINDQKNAADHTKETEIRQRK